MNRKVKLSPITINQQNDLPRSLQTVIDDICHHQHSMKPSLAKKIVLEAVVRMDCYYCQNIGYEANKVKKCLSFI